MKTPAMCSINMLGLAKGLEATIAYFRKVVDIEESDFREPFPAPRH